MSRTAQQGFSLLEMMIVLAIILVLTAFTVPAFLRARQSAYEASAVGFAHSVQADEASYRATHGSYATSFDQLPGYSSGAANQVTSGSTGDSSAGQPGSDSSQNASAQGQQSASGTAQDATGGFNAASAAGTATSTVIRNSYVFTLTTVSPEQWNLTAYPVLDRTDGLYVYADSTGALKTAKGGPPTNQAQSLHVQ